jgi:hypothetical protein
MATVKIVFYYDRVGLDCQTDGEVCERGYYDPKGWHYGKHQCGTCVANCGTYPTKEEIETLLTFETEAKEVEREIAEHVGCVDSVTRSHDGSIMVYGAESQAGSCDGFSETRQASIRGDKRLLRVLEARLERR